jgi:DNA/RNA-binding domain of Phe-tRNA-synthetase-like protein
VDACNAVSLHSGFPISVVDLDRAHGPFRIGVAPGGTSYVFNASGQEIDLGKLVCEPDGSIGLTGTGAPDRADEGWVVVVVDSLT